MWVPRPQSDYTSERETHLTIFHIMCGMAHPIACVSTCRVMKALWTAVLSVRLIIPEGHGTNPPRPCREFRRNIDPEATS